MAASFSVTLSVATTLPSTGASLAGATLTTTDCAAEVPPSPSETVRLMVRAAAGASEVFLVGNVFDQLLEAGGIRKPREIEHQGFTVGTVVRAIDCGDDADAGEGNVVPSKLMLPLLRIVN